MLLKSCIGLLILGSLTSAQTDNFSCPDEFEGYYPHLYSCDKYWKCLNGKVEEKTCGNGLAFSDLDETFTTENCDYIYNVDCGNRTELEPPISAPNCPRLYGTFPDPEDCSAFYNCRNGLSNRYSCAPGLAYDRKDRVCKWADQVKSCKAQADEENEEEEFVCPKNIGVGLFSKHAHPADCRQYFVCIGGVAREYGCPLGTVFAIGNDDFDGKCADPKDVPECSNYYGDLDFDKQELVRAGVDPEAVGASVAPNRNRISRPSNNNFLQRNQEEKKIPKVEEVEEERFVKPSPPKPASRPSRLRPRPTQLSPNRPQFSPSAAPPNRPPPPRTTQFNPSPTPSRPRPTPSPSFAAVPATPSPSSRPRPRITTTFAPETTTTTTTTSAAPLPSAIPAVTPSGDKQPAKVKAGEDYYYYYYYYDDEEEDAAKTA